MNPISKKETFYIQYLYDGKWDFAKDGDYRIEVGTLYQARNERDIVSIKTQCKARILSSTTIKKVVE